MPRNGDLTSFTSTKFELSSRRVAAIPPILGAQRMQERALRETRFTLQTSYRRLIISGNRGENLTVLVSIIDTYTWITM